MPDNHCRNYEVEEKRTARLVNTEKIKRDSLGSGNSYKYICLFFFCLLYYYYHKKYIFIFLLPYTRPEKKTFLKFVSTEEKAKGGSEEQRKKKGETASPTLKRTIKFLFLNGKKGKSSRNRSCWRGNFWRAPADSRPLNY